MAELALDKRGKAAHGLEDVAGNLVVLDDDAELLFQSGDHRDHGHRIEFGYAAEESSRCAEGLRLPAELQHPVENGFYRFQIFHEAVPSAFARGAAASLPGAWPRLLPTVARQNRPAKCRAALPRPR